MEKETVYYSISQINESIKLLFDNTITLKNIYLKGEISNYKGRNKSGHIYFTLKDEKSSLSAVMFKYDSLSLEFEPKNGDEVLVLGSISSYPPSGTYQIICKKISQFGLGESFLKKEQLKKKLFQEGLFNSEHKKELPVYPMKIAVITGKNSAAALDFEFNLKRRFPLVEVIVFPSLVQGENAASDLIKNLKKADESNFDLLIIGRGGGASEDLNAFDDENLVRTIYDLNTPIISAVGHEINKTLCDLVADKYASTPTGAAEIAVPNIDDVLNDINQQKNYLDSIINSYLMRIENKILNFKNLKYFQNISEIYTNKENKIKNIKISINHRIDQIISENNYKISNLKTKLSLLNPNNILEKGYTIVTDANGKVLNFKDIKIGENIHVKFSDGKIKANVKEKE